MLGYHTFFFKVAGTSSHPISHTCHQLSCPYIISPMYIIQLHSLEVNGLTMHYRNNHYMDNLLSTNVQLPLHFLYPDLLKDVGISPALLQQRHIPQHSNNCNINFRQFYIKISKMLVMTVLSNLF